MEIKVLFFGVLAEVANASCKHYFNVNSMGDLVHRIADDFPEMVHYDYRIAINNEIISGETSLQERDEVAFLPPFAGG